MRAGDGGECDGPVRQGLAFRFFLRAFARSVALVAGIAVRRGFVGFLGWSFGRDFLDSGFLCGSFFLGGSFLGSGFLSGSLFRGGFLRGSFLGGSFLGRSFPDHLFDRSLGGFLGRGELGRLVLGAVLGLLAGLAPLRIIGRDAF